MQTPPPAVLGADGSAAQLAPRLPGGVSTCSCAFRQQRFWRRLYPVLGPYGRAVTLARHTRTIGCAWLWDNYTPGRWGRSRFAALAVNLRKCLRAARWPPRGAPDSTRWK